MADSLTNAVARVIDMSRGPRKPAKAASTETAEASSAQAPSTMDGDDVPQLHLASSVAKAASEDS
jgi:hypothetical protein